MLFRTSLIAWLVVAAAGTLAAEDRLQFLSNPSALVDGDFMESLITPGDRQQQWEAAIDEPQAYFLRGRGGASYFDTNIDDRVGGTYALDLAVPIYRQIGVFASGSVNHFSEGTQFLGVLGMYKQGQMGCSFGSRFGYSILIDQFTDSRFDDLYIVQGRYSVSYLLDEKIAAGVTYSDPLNRSTVNRISFVPSALTAGGLPLRTSEVVEAYVSGWFEDHTQLTASIGYSDQTNSTLWSGSVRRILNEDLAATASLQYDDTGQWSAFAGLEVNFLGSNRTTANPAIGATDTSGDIVRGNSTVLSANSFLTSESATSGSIGASSTSSGSGLLYNSLLGSALRNADPDIRDMFLGGLDEDGYFFNPFGNPTINRGFSFLPGQMRRRIFLNDKDLERARQLAQSRTGNAQMRCPPGFTFFAAGTFTFTGGSTNSEDICVNTSTGEIRFAN